MYKLPNRRFLIDDSELTFNENNKLIKLSKISHNKYNQNKLFNQKIIKK